MPLKFQVPGFLHNRMPSVGGQRPRIPRASEIATSTPRVKRAIRKRSSQRSALAKQTATKANAHRNSLADVFLRQRLTQATNSSTNSCASEPKDSIGDVSGYIEGITRDIASGRLSLRGNPWVAPASPFKAAMDVNARRESDGERLIDPSEALNLVLRPWVFVWAPEKLCPNLRIHCPNCVAPTTCAHWGRARTLHSITGQCIYITTRHTCYKCGAAPESRRTRMRKMLLADAPEVMALLPSQTTDMWDLVDTGRTICDASVADLVRAMATRTSWAAIADTINEIKATTWVKSITLRYLQLCDMLKIRPERTPSTLPTKYGVHDKWLREVFVSDAEKRYQEVARELGGEKGDDMIMLDWTEDAAKRCGGNFLFNVMSGAGKVLLYKVTVTAGPTEVEPLMWDLKRRGVQPKVAYVDDGCCGIWKSLLGGVWPGISVRLDGMHAIKRLTQTTTSTRHPWHNAFCRQLSEAFYTYHSGELHRLTQAWACDGRGGSVPTNVKNKYVPKVVSEAQRIISAVTDLITDFQGRAHKDMGELLTPDTQGAWLNLKGHVEYGCLSDPTGMHMFMYKEEEPLTVGGERFRAIRARRGTSALEGFHTHQKQWLGVLAHHSVGAGMALLTEGALRWNRKRSNEAITDALPLPTVFANGILQAADNLYRRLVGERLYPSLTLGDADQIGASSGDLIHGRAEEVDARSGGPNDERLRSPCAVDARSGMQQPTIPSTATLPRRHRWASGILRPPDDLRLTGTSVEEDNA